MRRLLAGLLIIGGCGKATEPPWPSGKASAGTVASSASPSASASAMASSAVAVPAAPSSASDASPTTSTPASAPAAAGPRISTARFLSWVYEKPRLDASHAGWLRAGAMVGRGAAPVAGVGCAGKWWAIEPSGFVCEGHEGVTTRLDDKVVAAASLRRADEASPFPYGYATSHGAPLYARIPTREQQGKVEHDLAAHLAAYQKTRETTPAEKLPPASALPIGPVPSFLADHALAPDLLGATIPAGAVQINSAWNNMRLSLLNAFESDGRVFYLTTEHFIVPADRMRAARLAAFHGVELSPSSGEQLPLVWVRWKPVRLHLLEDGKAVQKDLTLPFQAHASIATKERVVGGVRYFELLAPPEGAPAGTWLVPAQQVTRVDAAVDLPYAVGPDELWIEVSIHRQTLVFYRGKTPLFATLVSTGVDVDGDPATSRATPKGQFRIHSKHVSWRMAAEEKPPAKEGDAPDPRYRIDDVPYVQYFHAGYALHAAFWHDSFGQPKSHGCINLSPRDALWMFGQTTPKVPQAWHGVYSGRAGAAPGTTLVVHD